jgi:hypothetical protein
MPIPDEGGLLALLAPGLNPRVGAVRDIGLGSTSKEESVTGQNKLNVAELLDH